MSNAVVLGLMRIASLSDAQLRDMVDTARAVGVTTFDHADIYGGEPHRCERRFGESGAVPASERHEVIVQSKVGIRSGWYDSSREHILASVDASLAALRTDYLDVLLLHRPDALVEPDEVAAAFDALYEAGKVRAFGVSNHTPPQWELLSAAVRQPLRINQVQFGLGHAGPVAQGLSANVAGIEQSASRDLAVLDHARNNDITVQAWSPLQGAHGVVVGDREHHAALNDELDRIAAEHASTPTAVALAWVLRHPARTHVVVGTTNPARVRDSAGAEQVVLSREEWYRLYRAAGYPLP
ncbi:aldo/keto reductase [Micropruina sp.]|uniref:aldo/keto reductase n=1 Tax=Micropruina sp. TaxID=2737536 RepID=UPI0039E38C63